MKIQNYIEKKVQAEAGKTNLVDEYGSFWFIVGEMVGNWLLGAIGAAADAFTLWGFLYLMTKSFWVSVIVAVSASAAIQIVLGRSVVRATKTAHRGDIKQGHAQYKGFRRQLALMVIIVVSMLTASLFISKVSDSPIKARTEYLREKEKINLEDVRAPFLARIEEEKKIYASDSATVWTAIERLQNDKVHDSQGKLVTRYAHLSTINRKMNDDLPRIEKKRDEAIAAIKREMNDAVYYAEVANGDIDAKYDSRDHMAETYVVGGNILFQLLRTLLLLGMTVFLVDAAETKEKAERNAQRNEGRNVAPGVAPANATPQDDFTLQRTIEMLQAKTDAIMAERNAETQPGATPKRNAEKDSETNRNETHKTGRNAVSNGVSADDALLIEEQLATARNNLRAYRSKLRNKKGNPETLRRGVAKWAQRVDELEQRIQDV